VKEFGTHIYLWVGINNKSVDDYFQYFNLDYIEENIYSERYKVCDFCKDIGEKYYDEDFILTPKPLSENVPVEVLIKDFFSIEREKIIKTLSDMGIHEANAFFGYATPDARKESSCLHIEKPYKEYYNGLVFVGKFIYG
jgi:glycosylphosphatidylinositol transamidase (GPIT) subunit GPI8